jgi:hypothetical protein
VAADPSSEDQSMAQLWVTDERADDGWVRFALSGPCYTLTRAGPRATTVAAGGVTAAVVLRGTAGDEWLFLAAPGLHVAVNGQPLVLGCRVLRDHDELVLTGPEVGVDGDVATGQFYFSTETRAHVQPLPPAEEVIHCGRCRHPIAGGQAAVQCPKCRVWQHQTAELPCWTYATQCGPRCDQSTALDADQRRSPEAELWPMETAGSVADNPRPPTEPAA